MPENTQLADVHGWLRSHLETRSWVGWMAYNDDPWGPEACFTGGHAKGIVVWDEARVGWLVHSVPSWPASFDGRHVSDLEDHQTKYGQSFVWLNLYRDQLDIVMRQLTLMEVHVCIRGGQSVVPDASTEPSGCLFRTVLLAPGVMHVAKSARWGKDLFEDLLCSEFGGYCLAETWLRPRCEPTEHVTDVEMVRWPGTGVVYHESHDHSKWAVADNGWTFIGDINRMTSQRHRGGGGVVLIDLELCRLMLCLCERVYTRTP
jgi:deoxyribonuclease-2